MASKYLAIGATDLSVTNSWSLTRNGATGAAVPTAGDSVFILEGTQTISAGLTTLDNVDLAAVTIGDRFTGTIGTPGSSVSFVSTAGTIEIGGSGGPVYVKSGTSTSARLDIYAANRPEVRFTGGTVTLLNSNSGSIKVDAAGVVTTHRCNGAVVEEAACATAVTTRDVTAGTVKTYRTGTTTNVDAPASLTMIDTAGATTLNINGGSVNKQSDATITTVNLRSGTFDPSGAVADMTVTTLNLYGNMNTSKFYDKAAGVSVTIGTTNVLGTAYVQAKPGAGTGA